MPNLSADILHREPGPYCNPLAGHLRRKHHVSGKQLIDKTRRFLIQCAPSFTSGKKRNIHMAQRTILADDFDESESPSKRSRCPAVGMTVLVAQTSSLVSALASR